MALTRPSDKMLAAGATLTLATMQATTSGTSIDFTGIPAGTKEIVVMFDGVSLDNTGNYLIQIGDAGGLETTGYIAICGLLINAGASGTSVHTTGFGIVAAAASRKIYGAVTLTLIDAASFRWAASGNVYLWVDGTTTNDYSLQLSGTKSLSAELDRLSVVVSGAGSFDAGNINIAYN